MKHVQMYKGDSEFMLQTSRVGAGKCNNHYIFCKGMYGLKLRSDAQTQERKRERDDKLFNDNLVNKFNVYNNC